MIVLLRTLGRMVTFVLLVVLALAGLLAAIFSIGGGDGFSLPDLAGYLQLDELRDVLGDWLAALESDGPTAWWTVLGGACAALIGLLLLAGVLVPRRERLVVLLESEGGRIAARRRPLSQAAEALALQQQGLTEAKARVRTGRWRQGSLRLRASRTRRVSPDEAAARASRAIEPLTSAFDLRPRVRSRLGEGAARVQ